eukprot:TRINITY_DN92284_c0_g1_i1.p1 TRINITY_DN92284_c0_g1~~TRINITY_DN92284_c0_g1_i1.p1  ORF type:complete len:246 (+),score=61.01 TRINITY_DN92284_c0_g1_i1:82-819(+)
MVNAKNKVKPMSVMKASDMMKKVMVMKVKQAVKQQVVTKLPLSKTGQHLIKGSGCIATELDGRPCQLPRAESHIPYCKKCMKTGDPSLKVVKHPKFGRCLIAMRPLKKGYYTAWWGKRVPRRQLAEKDWEWALETRAGIINAVPYGTRSQMQFCQCCGPTEKPTIDYVQDFDQLLTYKDKACLLFGTLCDVPRKHQLVMMYNRDEKTTQEFFEERGLVRGDVTCPKYPALKKASYLRKAKSSQVN